MSVADVISLLGGIALFLFGMSLMGEGLKKVAGSRLELVLYKLSSTPLKGVLLGTGVTAVIQSSSATSVMVVGFVNSGMMKVKQAIGVIMGAILGTSVTGWILCLSSLEGGSGVVQLLSTEVLTGIVAVVGIILRMFTGKTSNRYVGEILLGFAVLMYGMSAMSGAVSPLRESEAFIRILTSFSNPILGILVGLAFTSVLQSASAAVGILQALAITGAVTFEVALPIVMGIAIGAAVPVLLSALGANLNGKRTAFIYLLIDVLGVLIWALLFYGANAIIHFTFLDAVMSSVSIALMNTPVPSGHRDRAAALHRADGAHGGAAVPRRRLRRRGTGDGPAGGALFAAPGAVHRAEPAGDQLHGRTGRGQPADGRWPAEPLVRQGFPHGG